MKKLGSSRKIAYVQPFLKIAAAVLMTFTIIVLPAFAFMPVQISAEVPAFSNAASVENDVKALIQTKFDTMDTSIGYVISGNDACKLFLATDGNNDIVQPITLTSFCQDIFTEQLADMDASNYNAYTRFAMVGWKIDINTSYSTIGNEIVDIELTFNYTIDWRDGNGLHEALAGRNAVIADAQAFLSSPAYPSSGTNDQKLKAINEYICERFQYDYRLFVPAEADSVIYSAYQMISDIDAGAIGGYPRGVCQAYAMYGYIMLKKAGYEAITISGEAAGGGHAWNMVRVGTRWYHIDFTWDDPISATSDPTYPKRQDGAGTVSYNYFMRSDAEIQVNHAWDPVDEGGYVYPAALFAWSGTDPIVDITQPNPEPTPTRIPTPTKMIVPTATKAP
ncbi:MAG: transglutaminase domain-containing protein, partial [Saccharofermentanales bacterium]